MAATPALGAGARKGVRVRVPPSAIRFTKAARKDLSSRATTKCRYSYHLGGREVPGSAAVSAAPAEMRHLPRHDDRHDLLGILVGRWAFPKVHSGCRGRSAFTGGAGAGRG